MPASEAAARRRAGAALLAIGVAAAVLVPTAWLVRGGREPALADPAKGPAAAVRPKPNPLPELPGGGQVIFPGHRVVAYYGAPISERLGVLGVGTPDQMAAKLLEQTAAYDSAGLPALPAMELIATVASHSAGDDGTYRFRLDPGVVDEYLQAARRAHALLIIDVQPGRAHFLPEVKVYEKWLKEPDVSLALDPEWRVSPTGVPGKELGSVGAAEVNQVVEWLSGIVEQNKLPQKMLVIHQFTPSMITDRSSVQSPPGVAVVFDADGVGGRAVKMQKYRFLTENTKDYFQGFKLFYQTDTDLLTPKMVVKLKPRPDLVIYQ